jgi:hypothetical protein
MRNNSDRSRRENQNTNFYRFFFENRAAHEIIWGKKRPAQGDTWHNNAANKKMRLYAGLRQENRHNHNIFNTYCFCSRRNSEQGKSVIKTSVTAPLFSYAIGDQSFSILSRVWCLRCSGVWGNSSSNFVTRRCAHIPVARRPQLHRDGSLRSRSWPPNNPRENSCILGWTRLASQIVQMTELSTF